MGFLGIHDNRHLDHVPGTIVLEDENTQAHTHTSGLKHGTGKDQHIILSPQPSDDPNDPLNWSLSKKITVIVIISIGSSLYACTIGPLLNAGLATIAEDLGKTEGDITLLSGYQLLVAGASGPFVCALSRRYGKRPVFLASSLFGLIGSIVGSASNTFEGLQASRIIQGFSTSAFESLVAVAVGDLFFVHQRGVFMSLIQLVLGAVSNFSSVISGVITANLGWKYLFHILIAFTAAETILIYLFVPETQYIRESTDMVNNIMVTSYGKNLQHGSVERDIERELYSNHHEGVEPPQSPGIPRKKAFTETVAISSGVYSSENFLQLIISPFAVCLNVFVAWITVVYGVATALYVAPSYVISQIFSAPPYNLTSAGVGYLFVGPLVGGLVGFAFLSFVSDPLIRFLARKNGDVYEPEYRLLPMIGGLAAGVGLMVFGYMAENSFSYYATATMHGVALFGILCITVATSGYAVDAYRSMSAEILIAGMIFKNFLFYGLSYFMNNWVASRGPESVFFVLGGIGFALLVTLPPVFVFGKQYRSYWNRHDLVAKLHISTHSEI